MRILFVPPVNIGSWRPSPGTISEWIYQIWKYLQDNPIATQQQITEYVQSVIGEDVGDVITDILPEQLDQYFTANPIEYPVTSVNAKIGAVLLELADIVKSDSMLPIVSLANDEADQEALIEAFDAGARFCLIDDTDLSVMLPTYGTGDAVTAISLLPVASSSSGEGGDYSPITLTIGSTSKTLNAGGTVAFTLTDIGAASSSDLTTLGGRVTALETLFNSLLGVGAIYVTKSSSFDPNGVFPGTWSRLEHAFIYGADSSDTVNDTILGEATVTLSINEIPAHNHGPSNGGSFVSFGCTSGTEITHGFASGGAWNNMNKGRSGIANIGGGQPHNNMPPYLLRYIWERTA